MNVLFLTSTLPRFPNDSQAPFVFEQASAWKKVRPNDEITILAPHDHQAPKVEELCGLHIRRFSYWWPTQWQKLSYPAILPNIKKNPLLLLQLPSFLLSQFLNASSIVRKHKIDLIYAHWVMPQGLVSYLVNKIHNTPYVLQNHSSDLRIFYKLPICGKFLARKIITSSKKLFCVNSLLKNEALMFFPEKERSNIDPKIIVYPMGINYQFDAKIPSYSDFKYTFGLIGRLTKKKGGNLFIQALKQLAHKGKNFSTIIAGDGEEREELQQLSNGLKIHFPGFVSDHQKIDFFKNTQFIIFPSIVSKGDIEGLPVALLEALYFGKIVIASKATNIELLPEWGEIENRIFLLEDPHNIESFTSLLERLLNMGQEKILMHSTHVQSVIQKYKWDHLIERYIEKIG